MDALEILSSENQCETSIDITKGRRIHIPSRRWYSKIVRKRLRIPRTHSKAGTDREEWVDPRWLPSIVITLNLEFNSLCRRKKHSPFHWNTLMCQVYWYWSGRHARKAYWWPSTERKKLPKVKMWSGREIDKDPNTYQTRSCMSRSLDENW